MNARELIRDRLKALQDQHHKIASSAPDSLDVETERNLALNLYGQALLVDLLSALQDE